MRKWSPGIIGVLVCCQLGCSERAVDLALEDDEMVEPGMRPDQPGVAYAECEGSADCAPLEYCVHPSGEPGFCSERCDPIGDAESCVPSPGGTATETCADIGADAANLCALDCASNRTCPGGMRCEAVVTANDEERRLCF